MRTDPEANVTSKPSVRPPVPSSINKVYTYGPLYCYERISDEQARLVGVLRTPGERPGCNTTGLGWWARRLSDGTLRVHSEARLVRDADAEKFMLSMLSAAYSIMYRQSSGRSPRHQSAQLRKKHD